MHQNIHLLLRFPVVNPDRGYRLASVDCRLQQATALCLPRDALRKRGLCCRPVSVCLSVRLLVTFLYCIHTAEDIVKLLSWPGSPIIIVFLTQAPLSNFQANPFQQGVKYTARVGKVCDFSSAPQSRGFLPFMRIPLVAELPNLTW